jgi:two-component system OmpR family response regulator
MKILIIEDEIQIAEFLREILENENFDVTHCVSIEECFESKFHLNHDFIVLDLNLQGAGGYDLVKELRRKGSKIPILVLSALNQISTKIELINLGADDYMTKPFDAQELIARIRGLNRRYLEIKDQHDEEEVIANIHFFWKQSKILREGKTITLTKKEADLLKFLLQRQGEVVSIEDILAKIWKSKMGYQSNVVQATIKRLRGKIDEGFSYPLITNIHGIGYQLMLKDEL